MAVSISTGEQDWAVNLEAVDVTEANDLMEGGWGGPIKAKSKQRRQYLIVWNRGTSSDARVGIGGRGAFNLPALNVPACRASVSMVGRMSGFLSQALAMSIWRASDVAVVNSGRWKARRSTSLANDTRIAKGTYSILFHDRDSDLCLGFEAKGSQRFDDFEGGDGVL